MADQIMELWRVYATPDGGSSMEKISLPMADEGSGFGWDSAFLKGKGVFIKRSRPGRPEKWHSPKRRQLAFTISGMGELETTDGKKLTVKPGVGAVMEDMTGKGHITRVVGKEDRVVVFVSLDDDVKVG